MVIIKVSRDLKHLKIERRKENIKESKISEIIDKKKKKLRKIVKVLKF